MNRVYRIRHKQTGLFYKAKKNYNRGDWLSNKLDPKGTFYERVPFLDNTLRKGILAHHTRPEHWEVIEYEITEIGVTKSL